MDTKSSAVARDKQQTLVFDVDGNKTDGDRKYKFDLIGSFKSYVATPENAERLKKYGPIISVVVLFCLVIVGGYYLNYYSTYGRPKWERKYNIGKGCLSTIENSISALVLKKYQYGLYPPEDASELDVVDGKIQELMSFKKHYNAVKDDLYNYDPDLVPVVIIIALYTVCIYLGWVMDRLYHVPDQKKNMLSFWTCIAVIALFITLLASARCPVRAVKK